ncbi:hypothetical protein [Clostridium beijerinckii]|jgi:hypothetical protein|uniref:Uncharacterized protein n=1 Tax=Clostridium beijerinckii TaxID=1520 RepID=A0AAE2UYP0_CLOBE|nr:hypothetical protein [Clostridium beijerinckii]MBF7809785.1 hypothetical protein [Clostridium beijerinckii]NRT69433.1 putative membrane protein [Clostridium beijerinckii]NRT84419.1 putative membrane protein [Clostridium beijerinckii]NRU49021.1 putative membrane protein [Clostridium beijerinckii]NRZ32979.1 putative membrane protein [Clostridium beijerinckii]
MNSLFLGFVACFVAYFITDFFCPKLGIERLINSKRHMRISLFLIAAVFNIIGTLIIENFSSREYHFLLKSFLLEQLSTLLFLYCHLIIKRLNNNISTIYIIFHSEH